MPEDKKEFTRRVGLFKIDKETGKKISWVIEYDKDRVITKEYEDPRMAERLGALETRKSEPSKPAVNPTTVNLKGIIPRWCAEQIDENPVPGTDELRAEFFEALRELEKAYENNPGGCPGCERGKLQRRFGDRLVKTEAFKKLN